MKKFPPFWMALGLTVILAISGCASAPDTAEEAPPAITQEDPPPDESPSPGESSGRPEPDYAETRPRPAARDELTAVFTKGEVELDFRKSYLASETQLYTALYEGLFTYHPYTLEPVPGAAARYTISDDKKVWTFTIRDAAKYWNGDPVKAGDFKAAWISLLDPNQDSPYSSLFDVIKGAKEYRLGQAGADRIGIDAKDDKTLVVTLNDPAAFFPSMLCHHSFNPIHPSMLNESAWADHKPVSNGPFYIEEFDENHILLLKNKNYWGAEQVALNKLNIVYTDDDGDEAAALWNSGESRWIAGSVNIEALTDRSGIQVNAMFATYYYYIRSSKKPWDDSKIRRALSIALPWEELREGHYLPAKTLIFPIPGYPEIEGLTEANIEEAQKLLEEAGYAKGVGLPEMVIRITPLPEASRIAGLMASTWMEKLGVPIKIDVVPYNRYFQSLKQNDYEVGSTTWIGDFADPYTFLQMWRRDSNLNDAGYNDTDYEDLLDKSMTEDGTARWDTLAEAEKLLLSRGTVLPISYSPAINIVDMDTIDGWYPNVLDIHPFKYLSFKALRPLPGVAMTR